MKTWTAAACALVFCGALLVECAEARKDRGGGGGGGGGGGRGGGRHSYAGGGGGGTAVVSPDDVKDMQRVLTERGLYSAGVDGVMGPKTVEALKAFQAAEGLSPTGYLDRDSRARLGLDRKPGDGGARPPAASSGTQPSSTGSGAARP